MTTARIGRRMRPEACLARSSLRIENMRLGFWPLSSRCGGSVTSEKTRYHIPTQKGPVALSGIWKTVCTLWQAISKLRTSQLSALSFL